jgi:hypothetical protein
MRRAITILAVAGMIAVAILLATRTNEVAERAAPASIRTAVDASRETDPQRESPPSNERQTAVQDDGADASSVASSGWRVRVFDSRTDAPIVGATVSVSDSHAMWSSLAEHGIGADTIEGLRLRRESAIQEKTGFDGSATFTNPPKQAAVEARSGTQWAFTVVNVVPDNRLVTMKLAPDRTLSVRVLDATGTPVGGVPIAVRRQVDARPTFTWKWTDTDPTTGDAVFQHFQRRVEQGDGWHVLFAFPTKEQCVVPVNALTPPDPPTMLVLPDTGRIRVRVHALDGPVRSLADIELHLEAFESSSGGPLIWPDGPWSKPHIDANGEALVSWIGVGLHVKADLVRDARIVVSRRFDGPARAGDEVVCELVEPVASPRIVTGRFVLRDGSAWPATTVNAFITLFPLPAQESQLRTVDVANDGRFRMTIPEARPVNGTRAIRLSAKHPAGTGEVIATVALDQDIPIEGLDIGDTLFDFGEFIVSGRVVDPSGAAIAGATFAVHTRITARGEELWPKIDCSGTSRTTENGNFALHLPSGEARPSEALRMTTTATGFVTESDREVRRGDRNVEVVLPHAGVLAGWVKLDPGLAHDDVLLYLSSGSRQVVLLQPDATFEAKGLSPGTYSLEISRRGVNGRFEKEPAMRIENLFVAAGETCRDPRIQGVSIASVMPTLRIRIVDRASTPLERAAVAIVGVPDARPTLSDISGVCLVRCAALPVDLDVSAYGFARQRLVKVSADREVMLEAGIPIRLRIDAKASGREPAYLLDVMLFNVGADGLRRGFAWGPEYAASGYPHFDEHGELTLRMPAEGLYECRFSVIVLSDNVGRSGLIELPTPPHITVTAGPSEQLFELSVPQAAVDAAVQRASH